MVEEQAGIQVIGQVDPQTRIILLHLNEFAFLAHFLILVFTFLPLAGFQHQLVRRNPQYRNGGGNNIK